MKPVIGNQIGNIGGMQHITLSCIKRKSFMSAETFTKDKFITRIRKCSNTRAFGPDKLSIFHLKYLEPRAG